MQPQMSALDLILTGDPALLAIVRLSLIVSLSAVALAAIIGVPLGAFLALNRFRGREAAIVVLNALMGLPPVVVGLAVYLLLSRSGPLGSFGHLVHAAGDDRRADHSGDADHRGAGAPDHRGSLARISRRTDRDECRTVARIMTLIWDGRFSLVVALLAGFGRAAAEVGAIIIVGGNIDGFTRTMTTTIALETSKGDLPLAMGLGAVLITIIILVNAFAWTLRRAGERLAG